MAFPIRDLIFGSVTLLVGLFYQNEVKVDSGQFLREANSGLGIKISEYDFIIVGGGTSGSVLASQLAKYHSVLVLEAGGSPVPQMSVPANAYSFMLPETTYTWDSIPQTNCCHSNPDSVVTIAQGKVLGGSSNVNGMHYNRGHPLDYDLWAEMTGDPSWTYANLLKYFKIIEDFGIPENDHLGNGGDFGVKTVDKVLNPEELRRLELWNKAGREMGYESDWETSSSPQREGFGVISNAKRNNRRESAYSAYLEKELDNPNLYIFKYSFVDKVDFDGTTAVGVFYTRHGVNQYARARKEVILSAGTLNTPHILLKSGIGPREELEKASIPLILDLPVGETLQDHPTVRPRFAIGNEDCIPASDLDADAINSYLKDGTGPLANAFPVYGEAFIVSEEAKAAGEGTWPDIQLTASCNSKNLAGGGNEIQILVVSERPKSVGNARLDPDDPLGSPLLYNPNFLAHDRDLNVIIEGIQLVWDIANSNATAEIGVTIDRTPNPNCAQFEFATHAYWKCLVTHETNTNYHPVGTCPMGKVVDSELKVIGTQRLRVIDNSVQPQITNANTMSPALVIGYRGSDLLLDEWGRGQVNSGNFLTPKFFFFGILFISHRFFY